MRECLTLEPNSRPSIEYLFKHKFFDDIIDEVEDEISYLYKKEIDRRSLDISNKTNLNK